MKSAIVIGGASSVWSDAAAALDLFKPDLIIAVNDMIGVWPGHLDIAAASSQCRSQGMGHTSIIDSALRALNVGMDSRVAGTA